MRRFKADRDTGLTIVTFSGVRIRIDAGQEYATGDQHEIDVLQSTPGVVEVKEARRGKAKDKD